MWDDDSEQSKELIGSVELPLVDIVNAPHMMLELALVRKHTLRGTLTVRADFVNMSEDSICFHCSADLVSLKTLCCGFDNPYILIERARLKHEESVEEHILMNGEKNDLEAQLREL